MRFMTISVFAEGMVQKIVIDLMEISSLHYTPQGEPPEGVRLHPAIIMKCGMPIAIPSDGHLETIEKAWKDLLEPLKH